MKNITGYLIRADRAYSGFTESILYNDEQGIERVLYTGKPQVTQGDHILQHATPDLTLPEYEAQARNPVKRVSEDELRVLQTQHLAGLLTEPEPISAEKYDYLLEVLPPCRWHTVAGASVFHISERLTANLVQWCIKFSTGECYSMTQPAGISEALLADKVRIAWYDKTAKAQAQAHGVSPESWAKTIEDCASVSELDEIDGRV